MSQIGICEYKLNLIDLIDVPYVLYVSNVLHVVNVPHVLYLLHLLHVRQSHKMDSIILFDCFAISYFDGLSCYTVFIQFKLLYILFCIFIYLSQYKFMHTLFSFSRLLIIKKLYLLLQINLLLNSLVYIIFTSIN